MRLSAMILGMALLIIGCQGEPEPAGPLSDAQLEEVKKHDEMVEDQELKHQQEQQQAAKKAGKM